MGKRKDAFALADFDEQRILQRPYFRKIRVEYNIGADQSDEKILQELSETQGKISEMEKRLQAIKAIHAQLGRFRELINRYKIRLGYYQKRKSESLGVKVSELKRGLMPIEYLTAEIDIIELAEKFAKAYFELEKFIQSCYRVGFAERLKRARKAAGLTQKQLGDMIQISPNCYRHYENGIRDPNIPTILRLLKILPAKQLLGITD